jgi:5-methylcytosine-specific restriction protein B
MRIKAIGTVVANRDDGRTIEVEWDSAFQPKDWYFTAHWKTIQKLDAGTEEEKRLIDFAFKGAAQDHKWFGKKYIDGGGKTGKIVDRIAKPYSLEDLIASGVFLKEAELSQTLDRLRSKKNLILQGPPGVGKTFIARKLAYALMKEKDDERIEFVQFHQSYSYEDFVRGYRPLEDEGGKFGLQDGVFFNFVSEPAKIPTARTYSSSTKSIEAISARYLANC